MLAHIRIDWRDRRDTFEKGAEVESGAADQDWQSPHCVNVADFPLRHRCPACSRACISAVEHAVKTVLGTLKLVRPRRGAQDRQVAIDLRAVGVDDDTADLLCKTKCQRRLAARGRPGD